MLTPITLAFMSTEPGEQTMRQYTDEEIARIAHGAIRELQWVQGEPYLMPAWDALPQHLRESMTEGVQFARRGATDEQIHQHWLERRTKVDGYALGNEKNDEERTSPYLVSYAELPDHIHDRSQLFRLIVTGLAAQVLFT